jgi:ubiquinone/menaquinone biosynthesis C-methylase UbiE
VRIDEVAALGFGSAADVYERARPGYAPEAVHWLCERLGVGPGAAVLDLAAGTGKLTRDLVPSGARVIAVEPLDEMRAKLVEAVPDAEALAGMAEEIPLPDGSVDAVVCAQAFHWFQAEEALEEIHRVLRPGGGVGLLWNSRDLSDSLQHDLDELLEPFQQAAKRRWNGDAEAWIAASPLFSDAEHRTWPSEQRLTPDGLVEVVASRSYVATLDEDTRSGLLAGVRELAAGLPEPIVLRYVVDVFVADRR